MSDRIIRAASVRQVQAWQPQALSGSAVATSSPRVFSAEAFASTGNRAQVKAHTGHRPSVTSPVDAVSLFTPEQEDQIRQALEEAHARGIEAGTRQGFEQGFAQALEQAEAAFADQQQQGAQTHGDELSAALQSALEQTQAQHELLSAQLPEWITQMALAVARQVVGESALKNPADIAGRITAAVENVQENLRGNLQLVMHPDTHRQLAALKSSGVESLLKSVREDSNMAPGGFVLRTSHGEENHSLEARWKRAVETFTSDVKHQRFI